MTAALLRARAMRWVSKDFPGWIEVELTDAVGRTHRIVEKVPVLTASDLTPESRLPTELWLAADAIAGPGDQVRATFQAAVETTDGLQGVNMLSDNVRWI